MYYPQPRQNTQLNCYLPDFNTQEVNGILYFTVDTEVNGKQRWKTDGTTAGTILMSNANI